jgi:peptidoglycan hydrolase-like protein with peptidoglycan-binding domain
MSGRTLKGMVSFFAVAALVGCGSSSNADSTTAQETETSAYFAAASTAAPTTTSTTTTIRATTTVDTTTTMPPAVTVTTQVASGEFLAGTGSSGVNVVLVQRALVVLGFGPVAVDGSWGSKTQQAWDQFEASQLSAWASDGVFTSAEFAIIGGYASLYEPPVAIVPAVTVPAATIAPTIPQEPVGPSAQCLSTIEGVLGAESALASNPTMLVRDAYTGEYFEVPNKSLTDVYRSELRSMTSSCNESWPAAATAASNVNGCLGYSNSTLDACSFQNQGLKQVLAEAAT